MGKVPPLPMAAILPAKALFFQASMAVGKLWHIRCS
jgi:hypothetical protein